MANQFPDSAISSWGGFVYQGKVALYHSLKLLIDGVFNSTPVPEFELQLDSTDDFAIYVSGAAISVHQVKAKSSPYRSTFTAALEKSSLIDTDCSPTTVRYFHIANEINDSGDYTNSAGANVKFYEYDTKTYCLLCEIEEKTKTKIAEYLEINSLANTPTLVDRKYCYLSELITRQVIKAHGFVHGGRKENEVAYTERLASLALVEILKTDFHSVLDHEYRIYKLKTTFADAFEDCIVNDISSFSNEQVELARGVFNFIYGMGAADLTSILHSLRPIDPSDNLRIDDVQNYAEIITEISCALVLNGLPHYSKSADRYLPTAVFLTEKRVSTFKEALIVQIRQNQHLANVLFEYGVLITLSDVSDIKILAKSDKVTCVPYSNSKIVHNIVREFPVSIISRDVAEEHLNA